VETWLIVVLVVVAVALLALLALYLSKRSRISNARKREAAREHLQEAQIRAARADKEQALAEEQSAAARRELAEVQERAALAEQEARERAARADEDRTAAEQLRARAQKAAPDLVRGDGPDTGRHAAHADGDVTPDGRPGTAPTTEPGTGGATRR
jgi:FtsZ-interacting cell division protein ZipA